VRSLPGLISKTTHSSDFLPNQDIFLVNKFPDGIVLKNDTSLHSSFLHLTVCKCFISKKESVLKQTDNYNERNKIFNVYFQKRLNY
jgi:hypothetical protein